MKIVYFGSSEFARIVLESLIRGARAPYLVITTPDKPKGRGLKTTPTPVRVFAADNSLGVVAPSALREKSFLDKLEKSSPDVFVVVSYGKMIPKSLLAIPRIMPVAVHPSILPLYRGAAPINWTLIKGEQTTGVSIFKVNEKIDSGEVIIQEKIAIEDCDDALTLSSKLAKLGSKLLLKALCAIEKDDYNLAPQDEPEASFAPKLKKEDGRIVWTKDAASIRNLVRGLRGWPGSYTRYKDTILKIIEVEAQADVVEYSLPSTIIRLSKHGIYVAAGRGVVKIKKLKPQGKNVMDVQSFLCGHHLRVGEKFT